MLCSPLLSIQHYWLLDLVMSELGFYLCMSGFCLCLSLISNITRGRICLLKNIVAVEVT